MEWVKMRKQKALYGEVIHDDDVTIQSLFPRVSVCLVHLGNNWQRHIDAECQSECVIAFVWLYNSIHQFVINQRIHYF